MPLYAVSFLPVLRFVFRQFFRLDAPRHGQVPSVLRLSALFLVRLSAHSLVVTGHLSAEVTASGMDDQVQVALFISVHLDEVVPAAQGAQAPFQPPGLLQVPVAPELSQI